MTRRLLLPLALLATACGPVGSGRDAPDPPRGIFLIVVDTLRADRLSCYGYAGHRTPHADRLAAGGVRFARVSAVASWTVPSMGAMLTSRLPADLSLLEDPQDPSWQGRRRQRRRQLRLSLDAEPDTVAALLRGSGFRTAAFVDQPMLSPQRGFQRGFDDWYQPAAPGQGLRRDPDAGAASQGWASVVFAHENDTALLGAFETWLRDQAQQPHLFAWIHLLTPHRPYTPPQAQGVPESATPSERYDAEVRATDALLGRAVAAIETAVGPDHALVLLTSDHGEAFGEHGSWEHGQSLHREVLEVPLILWSPGRLPAGRTIDARVRTIDVAPTLLEVAGVETPAAMRGASLLPLLERPGGSRPVFAEGVLYGATERSYTDERYKLHVDEQEGVALYAVDADPEERVDLARREPERVAALRERMRALRAGIRGAEGSDAAPESEEALDALRALGYLE